MTHTPTYIQTNRKGNTEHDFSKYHWTTPKLSPEGSANDPVLTTYDNNLKLCIAQVINSKITSPSAVQNNYSFCHFFFREQTNKQKKDIRTVSHEDFQ